MFQKTFKLLLLKNIYYMHSNFECLINITLLNHSVNNFFKKIKNLFFLSFFVFDALFFECQFNIILIVFVVNKKL